MGQMRIINEMKWLRNRVNEKRKFFDSKQMLRRLITQLLAEGKDFSVKKLPYTTAFEKQFNKKYPTKCSPNPYYANSGKPEDYKFSSTPKTANKEVFVVTWR